MRGSTSDTTKDAAMSVISVPSMVRISWCLPPIGGEIAMPTSVRPISWMLRLSVTTG